MMRSLFSAISGLRNHQTFMDVVGNNIANVNTTGFKESRVTFQDILSQTVKGSGTAQGGLAGTDPQQVGLGMQLGGIQTIQTQGTLQSTGKSTDLAIQGDGFFMLSNGSNQFYTRDGSFDLDSTGTLISSASGFKVQGWTATANGSVDTSRPPSTLTVPFGQTMVSKVSTTAGFAGNLSESLGLTDTTSSNASGGAMNVTGTSTLPAGTSYTVAITSVDATGNPTGLSWTRHNPDGTTATGTATSASFTDGGATFTIAASSANKVGDQYYTNAQASTVTLYDSLGEPHSVRSVFQKTPTPTNTATWSVTNWASAGTSTVQVGTDTLQFDPTGHILSGGANTIQLSGPATGTPPGNGVLTDGAQAMSVNADYSTVTQLSGATSLTTSTDGTAAGSLSSFSIDQSGVVTGVYTNGSKQEIGQIALADFANPSGLLKEGQNLYTSTASSGNPEIGSANTGGRGQISAGFLEMSNVDLSQQFTNMILAERGFQANSRVITTSDQILDDLVNIQRG